MNKFQQVKYVSQQISKNMPDQFCAAPFNQMFLYPTGDVFVCCEGGGFLGNVKNNTLEELWNGEKAQTLRKEFLEGKPKQCKKNIECKGCNKSYNEQLIDTELTPIVSKPPQVLDLILNGKCNIDCIMCEVKNETRSLLDVPSFHTEIVEKVIPQVKTIALKSGEPFVQKETYWLIDKLKEVNPNCEVRFTTNGQYNFNDKIKSELKKIKVEKITFSIDSIYKDTFEKVRAGGNLVKLLKTIDDVKNWIKEEGLSDQIELNANITLQKDNWKDIPETFKYLFDNKIAPHIIIVEKPEQYSLGSLSDAQFVEVMTYYLNLGPEYGKHLNKLYLPLTNLAKFRNSVLIEKLSLLLMKTAIDVGNRSQTCVLPFTQMSIFPNGKLRPCCWLNNYDVRKEKDGDFKKAWNDEPIKKIRKQFVENKLTICQNLVSKTSCNSRNKLPTDVFDVALDIDKPPQKLHWYFSGSCNLECPTCRNWQFKDEFDEADIYWQQLQKDIFPNLCEIEVVGGEPFYQKRTFQLMEKMLELNPDCLWYITSNGQFNFKGKIENALKKLRISYFSVSIDSLIPEKFHQIRKNGILEKTVKFLDDLIEFRKQTEQKKKFKIIVNFVLQKDNYTELEAIMKFVKDRDIALYVIPMIGPIKFSIYDMPSADQKQILQKIRNLKPDYGSYCINIEDVITDLSRHLSRSDLAALESIDAV
ncbi:MAG: radical SAM protein [Pseudobdellovibrio sp.]